MKNFRTQLTPALLFIITPLLILNLGASRARAAADTWTGGGAPDGNWQNANNWGGLAPLALDSLFFDGSTQTSTTNNFTAGTAFANIGFSGAAGAFTLDGNSVTLPTPSAANYTGGLNANYSDGTISNLSFSAQTINLPLTLANGQHNVAANTGGGSLNLAGAITLGSAASASFSDGVNVTGSGLSTLNDILGGWATLLPPTTWATLDGSGNVVGYTAFTDVVGGGTISSAPASNVRIASSGAAITLVAAGLTDINTLFFGDGGAAQTVDVAAGKILRFGAKGGIFNASRQLGATRILTIGTAVNVGFVTAGGADNTPGDLYLIETPFIGNTGNQLVMNSRITNNGTGAVTVHTFGHISYPDVTHSYSGGTYIHGGRIQTRPDRLGTGPIFIYPGGQLFFNANATCTNPIFMAGLGNGEANGNGAIRMGGSGRIITGVITLTADAATANGTFNGRITGPGGLIVGAGNANGVGTMIIGATNDYAGDTLINGTNSTAASTLQMTTGRPHTMPHGAGKGNLILNGAAATPSVATFNLNGTDQTINGLNSTGTVARAVITSGTAGPATLFVGDANANGSFGGTIQNGTGTVGLTKIGSGTQTLTGVSTYTGATTVNGGALVFGVGAFPAGTPAVTVNNATLDLAAVTPLTLAASSTLSMADGRLVAGAQSGPNSLTTSNLTVGGTTNYINVASIGSIGSYPAQLTIIKYTTLTGSLNFGLGALPVSPGTPFAGFISNNVANNSVDLVITAGPATIKWSGYSGGAPSSVWDIAFTPNWVTLLGAPTTYADGQFVQFDNSASNGVATLSQDVAPAGITVSNTSLAYTINGGSKISGAGGLTKQGSGTLIFDNAGANDFSGNVSVSAGTLQLGNNDSGGSLPATASVVDNGALVFNRSDTVTVPNVISGTGTVAQNGSGILNLSGANTFTGAVTVASGATLLLGNNLALGTTNGGTTIINGGTLDFGVNSINIGAEPITASGSGVGGFGAIVNNSGSATFVAQNFTRLTLAGDTTIGGSGRFDLRANPTGDPTLASLSSGGLPRKLTKVGGNQFSITGVTVDPELGDIEVQAGILSVEAATTTLGNSASNLTVLSGASLNLFAPTNRLNKRFVINDGGAVNNTSGSTTIIGPMNLTNSSLSPTPYCTFNIGGVSLNLSNVLSGDGILYKSAGAGLLTLSGNSPAFAGGIYQSAGALILNGTLSNTLGVTVSVGTFSLNGTLLGAGLTNGFGTTLTGFGTSIGTVDSAGLVLPGNTNLAGTLTVGGLVLGGSAALTYDLAATTTPGGGTNDLIVVNGDLTVNGNAITINPLGLLMTGAGNPYRLFNYTGNLIWNADLSVTGPNNYTFTVDTNTPGQVNIVASGGPPVWNGGSATTSNWSDPANWNGVTIVSSDSLFFNGPGRLSNVNDTTADTSYSELNFVSGASAFVLSGNPINLVGNVINNSSNPQTVDIGLDFSGARTLNGAGGPLIIGGGVTNLANLSTLTLAGTGTLTNLLGATDPTSMTNIISFSTNANWTLMDNPASAPITTPVQLDIAAGTFNFGQGASAPNLSSSAAANNSRLGITANAPATFNMVNGTLTIAARLNTGTAANTVAALNQSGGTLNCLALLQCSDGSSFAATTVNITGGTLNVGDAVDPNNFFLASRGTGVVTVASSGVINCATLDMSRNAAGNTLGSVGVVNLNGGILAVTRVGAATSAAQAGGTPTATFNFNGGTLKARASSTTFYQGNASAPAIPITSIVKAGGAIIDTTNFNITILEPLQHDATLGSTKDGGLTKYGTGTLTLTAASTYTGVTVVNNGTLAVIGSLGQSAVTVATNATLSGTGTAGTNITVNAGGTVSPGGPNVIGTLTVAGSVTLQSGSTAFMELNKASTTSDLLRATAAMATTITYGGTLSLTNLAGTLAATDTFKLFSATNYAGSFSAITPAIPAPGLGWNTNTLTTDGILRLVATVNTTPTNITAVVSGTQLNLSWPADHIGWRLQAQTNAPGIGLNTNWGDVTGSTTVNSVSLPIDPANGSVFYRMIFP